MEQRGNKTIMCSVLFLDIVAYTRKSVTAQIALKTLFNQLLADAILPTPVSDRVILDTGDGAAVTFLGDVEDALKAAIAFRGYLISKGSKIEPPLHVRMSINLGPISLVKDINGHPNIVGDGIKVALHIMGFARSGQILISTSYFDAVSLLSQKYAGLFHAQGSLSDSQIPDQEIYAVGKISSDSLTLNITGSNSPERAKLRFSVLQAASSHERALYSAIGVSVLALFGVITLKISTRPVETPPPLVVENKANPIIVSAISNPVSMVVNAAVSTPSIIKNAKNDPALLHEVADKVGTSNKLSPPGESTASKKPQPTVIVAPPIDKGNDHYRLPLPTSKYETTAKAYSANNATANDALASSRLSIAVTPWGEVYLDGKIQGVFPPLAELRVTPGEHVIEIRNTTLPPFTTRIEAKADESQKIRYKFANP
jgi:hypothetical protein